MWYGGCKPRIKGIKLKKKLKKIGGGGGGSGQGGGRVGGSGWMGTENRSFCDN